MRNLTNLILIILLFTPSFSHGQSGDFPSCDPDSLVYTEISGSVILSVNGWFIDSDGDEIPEYRLNFGPYWYTPDQSDASRPEDGALVSITGGLNEYTRSGIPVIIVYSINGLFWRNPYATFWNHFNQNYHPNGMGSGYRHAPGWLSETPSGSGFTGMVLVDSTFTFCEYFLDTDLDGYPDLFLNFGSPWYEPPGNMQYPKAGDRVSLYGGLIDMPQHQVLIVQTLNGQTWQHGSIMDSESFGGWMARNQNHEFHDPFDRTSMVTIDRYWHQPHFPQNVFCQMTQTHYQLLPVLDGSRPFAAFEVGAFFSETGMGGMGPGGGTGGMGPGGGIGNMKMSSLMDENNYRIDLGSKAHIQFHYSDRQLQKQGITGRENVNMYGWDDPSRSWVRLQIADRDLEKNIVSTSSSRLYAFYLLTWDQKTTSVSEVHSVPQISHFQIHGNPGHDFLKVNLDLNEKTPLQLDLFNAWGIRVMDLVNTVLPEGKVILEFPCSQLVAGMYYLRLTSSGQVTSRPFLIQH